MIYVWTPVDQQQSNRKGFLSESFKKYWTENKTGIWKIKNHPTHKITFFYDFRDCEL